MKIPIDGAKGRESEGQTNRCPWCYCSAAVESFGPDPWGWRLYNLESESYYLVCADCRAACKVWAVDSQLHTPWYCGGPEDPMPMIDGLEGESSDWTILTDLWTGCGAIPHNGGLGGALPGTKEFN